MKTYLQKNGMRLAAVLVIGLAVALGAIPTDPALVGMAMAAPLMVGDTSMEEFKRILEDQGKAWEEFRKANDQLLKAKAEGKAVADLEAKVAKIGEALDKVGDLKQQFESAVEKMQRPGTGSAEEKQMLAIEVKNFNLMRVTDAAASGKQLVGGQVTEEHYLLYKSGLFKFMRTGNLEALSGDERKAMIAGGDPDGGYLLPPPTVGRMVKRMYEQSIMRQIATIQAVSGPFLEGISDTGEADAGWVSETGARNETTTPQLGKYRIEAHEMYAAPRASQQLIDDAAVDVEGYLADKVADKFGRVEGAAFWTGNGVGQPRGLADYPTAATADSSRAWGTFEHVNTGANGAFYTTQFDPVHDLMGACKDWVLQNGIFVMRREVRTAARKLKESTTNRYLWEPGMQQGQPERLMGYPARVDQYMPALATGSLSLAFGDFREAYTVVDRIGVRTLRDPYTAKPYIVFYSTKRTGGGAVNFEAVKFLRFSA